jgi:putative tryptophan/tyrosine transport system substrate-binding protein
MSALTPLLGLSGRAANEPRMAQMTPSGHGLFLLLCTQPTYHRAAIVGHDLGLGESSMRRREFMMLFCGTAATWPLAARAQQAKIRRIGLLRAAPQPEHELAAFLRALAERGYVQGRNFVLVPQVGDGVPERLPELATALVNQGVDVIVTEGGLAVRAAAMASGSIPIVTASAADPFLGGLVKNLSHPGGNITGFVSLEKDISSKVFEILKEMIPTLGRVAVLASRPIWSLFAPGQDQAAKALGIEYGFVDMPQPETVGAAMDQALAEGAQGVVVRGSPYFSSVQRRLIIDSAAEHRLPAIYERRDDAERGGLVSYAPNVEDQYRATAEYVVRVLAGENPGELPIQQPTKFEMVINLKTAKVLGIEIAPTLLARADEVIE